MEVRVTASHRKQSWPALLGGCLLAIAVAVALWAAPSESPRPIGQLLAHGIDLSESITSVSQAVEVPRPGWLSCGQAEINVVATFDDLGRIEPETRAGQLSFQYSEFIGVTSLKSLAGFSPRPASDGSDLGEIRGDPIEHSVVYTQLGASDDDYQPGPMDFFTDVRFRDARGGIVATLEVPTMRRSFRSCWIPMLTLVSGGAFRETSVRAEGTIIGAGHMTFVAQERTLAVCSLGREERITPEGELEARSTVPCGTNGWIAIQEGGADRAQFAIAVLIGALVALALQMFWDTFRPRQSSVVAHVRDHSRDESQPEHDDDARDT